MTKSMLINFILFQLGWFACVLGGAWGYPIRGALLALMLVGVHLLLTGVWCRELRLVIAACVLGVTVDSLQQAAGIFAFTQSPGWPLWLPPWVFVIWAQFATLFHYALRWLAGRYLLAAVFGGVGGPLAYWAGIRLGAATFGPEPVLSVACLAMTWALVTPFLLWLAEVFEAGDGRYRIGSR